MLQAYKYATAWLASENLKDNRIMTWPSSSPDQNPIEALLKLKVYNEGKHYTLNSVCGGGCCTKR